jgi:hypothetical protein
LSQQKTESQIGHSVAALLAVAAVSLALLIGDIGFQGDDWWQFSWPYWNKIPWSIQQYAAASSRPLEGLYTVLSFELFGLHRVYYTACALFLWAGACLAFGACLRKAFPGKKSLALLATLFAFLLPSASNLIYMFHTDNSRVSVLLFWLSVLAFQRWARVSGSWIGLLAPMTLSCMAALTYENTTFLIFTVPFFVWPVRGHFPGRLSARSFLIRLFAGIGGAFGVFLAVRFGVFSGGAVHHSSLIPPLGLVWSYVSQLILYCVAPFRELSTDHAAWVWGSAVALAAAWLLRTAVHEESRDEEPPEGWEQNPAYIATLGVAVLCLGMLPYLLAGYSPDMGFNSQSRVYSSASFGPPILIALLATAWRNQRVLAACRVAAVLVLGVMAVFLASLRGEWQAAAEKRNLLIADLVRQVPNVRPGTTLLFLDLQWYLTRSEVGRAVVFQGVDGLGEFVRMLYHEKDLYAYFLYPRDLPFVREKGRIASVSPDGLTARGSAVRPPIPLDTLLIFKREGTKLVLLNALSAEDGLAAVEWNGVSSLESNRDLIVSDSGANGHVKRVLIGR